MFQRPCASYLVSSRLRPGISRLSPSISRLSPGSPPFLPNALRLSLNGSRLSRRGSPPLSGRRARCASNWRRHSTRYGFLPFACGRVSSPFLAEQGYGEDVHVPAAPVHEGFRVIPRPSEPFPRRRRTAREASRTISRRSDDVPCARRVMTGRLPVGTSPSHVAADGSPPATSWIHDVPTDPLGGLRSSSP